MTCSKASRAFSQAELKHARVCMLAFAGYVSVDLGFRVPFAPEVRAVLDIHGQVFGMCLHRALVGAGFIPVRARCRG